MLANYTAELVEDKKYQVTVDLSQDRTVEFFCVVNENESELDELVTFYLDYLTKPPVTYEAQPAPLDLNAAIQELKAIVDAQGAEIASLKGASA
jgi:hypothetical protein